MNEFKHTPEPWRLGKWGGSIISDSADGLSVSGATGAEAVNYYGGNLIAESVSENNANRIVECVNAMAGIENPASFMECVKVLELDAFQTIQAERNELLECLQDILQRFRSCIRGGNGELPDDKPAIAKAGAAIEISFHSKAIGR